MTSKEASYQPVPAAEESKEVPNGAQEQPQSASADKANAAAQVNASVLSQVLTSLMYVTIWISLSGAVILYNKWILVFYGFPFPITLTMWHMAFSASLATILVRGGWVAGVDMSFDTYLRAIVPVAFLFAGTLWLGNSAYMFLSVSFIQMLKALMPVAVFCTGCLFKVETFSIKTFVNMAVVTVGVAIASYGELTFVLIGVILQLIAIGTESTRLILVQILLQSRGLKLNPITTLYYIAPASFGFLAVLWLYMEAEAVLHHPIGSLPLAAPILISNAAIAFGLNLSVFLLIGKTSALAMNIAGVVKDWLLIGLSTLLFNAQLSVVGLGGYGLAFGGVCFYNYTKIRAMKAKQEAQLLQKPDKAAPLHPKDAVRSPA